MWEAGNLHVLYINGHSNASLSKRGTQKGLVFMSNLMENQGLLG